MSCHRLAFDKTNPHQFHDCFAVTGNGLAPKLVFAVVVMLIWSPLASRAEETPGPLFERDVLPILNQHCLECHGAETQEMALDLRRASTTLHGSENGPVIAVGNPDESLMLELVSRGEMPPDEDKKLDEAEVALLRRWIQEGARAEEPVVAQPSRKFATDEDRQFWAFQQPVKQSPPTPQQTEHVRTAIDAFVLSKLEENALTFSRDADRTTLLRRAYLDLIGLPPSPEELEAFLADRRPDAYERLLDQLLASPHYGERWGRHWLDAAGYVDVRTFDGDLAIIFVNEGIWRYRDYVVRSFNTDKPYDQFVTEQLAGDELVDWQSSETLTPQMQELLVATGYLRHIEDHTEGAGDRLKHRYDVVFGLMETVSTSLLGITLDCARCHNHKYDPISQRDYYRFLACFAPALNVHDWMQPEHRYLAADISRSQRKVIDEENEKIDGEIKTLKEKLAEAEKSKEEKTIEQLKGQVSELEKSRVNYEKIQALWDTGPPPLSRILRRGSIDKPGTFVQAGFVEVLGTTETTQVKRPPDTQGNSSGRRLALARWLTDRQHPLAARVIVNRVWHHHFGVGIVGTLGNFGSTGDEPTHPELLDWLAVDFMENGWSLKRLHKMIMSSTVFQQSSKRVRNAESGMRNVDRANPHSTLPTPHSIDPENKLLWRMNLQRLEAEILRDAMLAACGRLDRTPGGPAVMLTTPPDGLSQAKLEPTPTSHLRRSVYLLARRTYPLRFLEIFDAPVMAINCTRRINSATVLQSFALLNSQFVNEHAESMATRVHHQCGDGAVQQIKQAYRLALTRTPTASEQQRGQTFLADQTQTYIDRGDALKDAQHWALVDFCQMLLSTNEFLYVE